MSETTAPVALLIEDEVGIRRFLRAALEGQGFTCVEATTIPMEAGLIEKEAAIESSNGCA